MCAAAHNNAHRSHPHANYTQYHSQLPLQVFLHPDAEGGPAVVLSGDIFSFLGVKGHGTRCVLSSAVPAFCERRKIYRKRRKIYPLLLTSGERFTHSY